MKNEITEARHLKWGESLREGETLTPYIAGAYHLQFGPGMAVRKVEGEDVKAQ